jgi:hypothetical protein
VKLIFFILAVLILAVPVIAQEQTTFYFANVSINYNALDNPLLQWRIHQGAEVYTGRIYDIRGAIGTSDYVAHWSDWKVEDQNCAPDTIIPVRYVESNGAVDPGNFYIDPTAFPPGNYFAWDGCREWTVLVKNPDGTMTTQVTTGQARNENRFAFTVKAPKKVMIPVHKASLPDPYTLPAFAIPKPVQTAAPVIIVPDSPAESAPWYIQWWWLELIVGVIAFVLLNDEYDIL